MLLTYKKAIIIGSDIPNITKKVIYNAFNKLNTTNCVLGPATDGGYYLIGFNNNVINNINNIFDNISWSTSKVLNETIDKLNKNNISYTKILELDDIDTIEDLKKYMKGINNVLF